MVDQLTELDRVFTSLADPTRRAVVERLGLAPASTMELYQPFDMALPSFMQHLGVLEGNGMVTSAKRGRVRTYELLADPLTQGERWLAAQLRLWERRLDQLDGYLEGRL